MLRRCVPGQPLARCKQNATQRTATARAVCRPCQPFCWLCFSRLADGQVKVARLGDGQVKCKDATAEMSATRRVCGAALWKDLTCEVQDFPTAPFELSKPGRRPQPAPHSAAVRAWQSALPLLLAHLTPSWAGRPAGTRGAHVHHPSSARCRRIGGTCRRPCRMCSPPCPRTSSTLTEVREGA